MVLICILLTFPGVLDHPDGECLRHDFVDPSAGLDGVHLPVRGALGEDLDHIEPGAVHLVLEGLFDGPLRPEDVLGRVDRNPLDVRCAFQI